MTTLLSVSLVLLSIHGLGFAVPEEPPTNDPIVPDDCRSQRIAEAQEAFQKDKTLVAVLYPPGDEGCGEQAVEGTFIRDDGSSGLLPNHLSGKVPKLLLVRPLCSCLAYNKAKDSDDQGAAGIVGNFDNEEGTEVMQVDTGSEVVSDGADFDIGFLECSCRSQEVKAEEQPQAAAIPKAAETTKKALEVVKPMDKDGDPTCGSDCFKQCNQHVGKFNPEHVEPKKTPASTSLVKGGKGSKVRNAELAVNSSTNCADSSKDEGCSSSSSGNEHGLVCALLFRGEDCQGLVKIARQGSGNVDDDVDKGDAAQGGTVVNSLLVRPGCVLSGYDSTDKVGNKVVMDARGQINQLPFFRNLKGKTDLKEEIVAFECSCSN